MTRFPLYIVAIIIGLLLAVHFAFGHEAKKGWEGNYPLDTRTGLRYIADHRGSPCPKNTLEN